MVWKMLKKGGFKLLPASENRRLGLPLLLSILVHGVLLMNYGAFSSPNNLVAQMPLSVKLLGTPAVLPVQEPALREVRPTAHTQWLGSLADTERAVEPLTTTPAAGSPERRVKSLKRFDKPKQPVEEAHHANPLGEVSRAVDLPEAPVASMPLDIPRQADQSPGIPLPSVTIPVRKAEIEFSLYSGVDGVSIGSVRHSFKSMQTDTGEYYSLDVRQSANPVKDDGPLTMQLNVGGRVLGDELVARRYSLKGETAMRFFSLREASVRVPAGNELSGSTPDGLIDRQTLLYYFSRKPPSFDGGGVWLSDNSRNGYYRYRVDGFENFVLPGYGSVRTLKVVVSESDKGEAIELWLAADLRYLPVRVRHKDRGGLVTDQVATSLSVE